MELEQLPTESTAVIVYGSNSIIIILKEKKQPVCFPARTFPWPPSKLGPSQQQPEMKSQESSVPSVNLHLGLITYRL